MIRAFPVIYNNLKSGYLHNWTEYAKYLNSDVNSLYEYLAYFHPDYTFLNDSIAYATDTGEAGTIEAPFTEDQLFTYGLKCHCFVVRLQEGNVVSLEDSFSAADSKPTSSTVASTEYLIYDNAIYVGKKSGSNYTNFSPFSSSDNYGSIAQGIVAYTIYFPYYLHFHQGMVNTDVNSMAFFGTDAEWVQIGGIIVEGTKEKYYIISQTQYDLMLTFDEAGLIELRLKVINPEETSSNQIVYPRSFQFKNATQSSETYEVYLENVRFVDLTNSNIYYTNIVLPSIKSFPTGTLVISNAQTTKGMDIPTSAERLDPNNYIFIPKNNPGIYTMSFNASEWTFTYNSQVDVSAASNQYFSFNTYIPRYSNFNEATQWWVPYSNIMTLPAVYYENTWDDIPNLYIADRVGYVWNSNVPLQHELYHVRKEGEIYHVEHFITSDHSEAYIANVANKAVGYYTITIENKDNTPTVTQDESVYIQIR